MSSYEAYLFNQQLPDNEFYRVAQNIVTIISIVAFSITYLIIYMSPSSRESPYYKALAHSQAISLLLFCFVWSFLMKVITHLNRGFFYSEGYCQIIGLTTASGYILLCIIFGNFATITICAYLFRLYLLVDHTHLLRAPYFFLALFLVLEVAFVLTPSVTFAIGYTEFDPNTLSLNLSQEQLDYMYSRSVTIYRVQSVREAIYPIYFVFLLGSAFVIALFIIYNIVNQIKKKQSLMSVGATKHHLRVLKVLTIQVVCILFVSCGTPFAVTLTLFMDVHSYIVTFCVITLGLDSVVNSLLTLFFNPVLKRTILTLFKTEPQLLRTSQIESKRG